MRFCVGFFVVALFYSWFRFILEAIWILPACLLERVLNCISFGLFNYEMGAGLRDLGSQKARLTLFFSNFWIIVRIVQLLCWILLLWDELLGKSSAGETGLDRFKFLVKSWHRPNWLPGRHPRKPILSIWILKYFWSFRSSWSAPSWNRPWNILGLLLSI